MKAIRVHKFGDDKELKLEKDVPVPSVGEGQVLVKVEYAGVNPVDAIIRLGYFGPRPFPFTPGMDAAGIVEQVGAGVDDFKKGDRVYTLNTESGSYAQYTVAQAKHVAHLHPNLSFQQGAGIGVPYYTAYRALFLKARGKPGETVLVNGASGAVGIAAVQIAKANGFRVLGTAGTSEGLKLVKDQGADLVFNHREAGYMNKVKEATGGKGPNIILEMVGHVNLERDTETIGHAGRIIIVGAGGKIEISPGNLLMKEAEVIGMTLLISSEEDYKQTHAAFSVGQRLGWLKPIIAKEYPLAEAGQSNFDVMNKKTTEGKLVINVNK